ncbi:uncharacterized protein Z520_07031 [Fonsecaea multimorphosa CBS 102226]|uniref:Aminotransferase class I/classII large domain-containing protein n=1 Tax=Fonsecaea multimorphosa CBS 102226 TaxID=1442371 RepID=A0A0D2JTX8_9EURO|nr:uncharacterized protein Z520_07031 [Fonsecaea multimorphosa CBS 102226]KIX96917.1 hypothetical protein Z520_07031 [Fonsecaea multimorphosa CBS 102226]OAL23115.1 hypothetical protein AYO22_06608 [Fonsecaea multimorphosa]
MVQLATFQLAYWIEHNKDGAQYVLGGSATPGISLDDLVSLSTDPAATEQALEFRSLKMNNGSPQGTLALRERIASLYDADKGISPENVITATATTGANLTVFQSLLHAGDHAICQYPTYPQLLGLPESFPCDLSYWKLDPENGWQPSIAELRKLVKPSTKMIILNNPSNPTGFHIDGTLQEKILDVAREYNIIVFADEIFRPLFHSPAAATTPSLVEHTYSRVVVTSSMSKVWGMSGVRIGWIVSRDRELLALIFNTRQYTVMSTSLIDEVVATEALSPRCRPIILKRHLEYAQKNLALYDAFVEKNSDMCSWVRPEAGAIGFVRFSSPDGKAVDDVEFCQQLQEEEGVLISPGNLCFSAEQQNDFRGYMRMHFTLTPDSLDKALEKVDTFLARRRKVFAATSSHL